MGQMRVLIATDGSPDAASAAAWARYLPLPADTRYRVISVVAPPTLPALAMVEDEVLRMAVGAARGAVASARAELPGTDAADDGVIEGSARDAIVAAAAEWRADLVILGARGLGAVAEFLLGSVSLGVARHAPCPVLICKGSPRSVRTIAIAHDGSPGATAAVQFVTTLRLPHHARLTLLGVAERVHYPTTAPGILGMALRNAVAQVEAEHKAVLEQKLKPALGELWDLAATVDMSVVLGNPAAEIIRHADGIDADLIVVGARGMNAVERALLGSVSEAVMRHARCPVLVVRERR